MVEGDETLREEFLIATALTHFDGINNVVVKTDASDLVSVGVLSQQGDDRVLHPLAFYSKNHSSAEANNEI